jgi:succinate dehydrogenase / fumarate reductase, membrane anchor subunit
LSSGRGHWRWQRLTALALLPLSVWLLWSWCLLRGTGFAYHRAWFAAPFHALLLALLVLCLCWHSWLGVQVVIEDYIPGKTSQRASLWANRLLHAALAVVGLYAIASLMVKS